MPSRQFYTQQATLDVLHTWYPHTLVSNGTEPVCDRVERLILSEFQEGQEFCLTVRNRFRALVALHGEPE